MISTINITTAATVTALASTASLGFVGVFILLLLLVHKEVATTVATPQAKKLSQVLNIAIVPLLIIFVVIVAIKIAEVLG